MGAVREAGLQGLLSIVRHGVRRDLEIAHHDGFAISREVKQLGQLGFAHRPPSAAAHPDRNAVTLGERDRTPDVIAMFVRHEDRINVCNGQLSLREPDMQLPLREAAIDQHAAPRRAAGRFDQRCVAAASASQAAKAQHYRKTIVRRRAVPSRTAPLGGRSEATGGLNSIRR